MPQKMKKAFAPKVQSVGALIKEITEQNLNIWQDISNNEGAIAQFSSLFFMVTNYGAVGDGKTDNTTSIQNAVNAAQDAGGGVVLFPAGQFLTGQINITASIMVMGSGIGFEGAGGGTRLLQKVPGGTIFYVNCEGPVVFRDFGVSGLGASSGGAGIAFDWTGAAQTGTGNLFSQVMDVVFDQIWVGVQIIRASNWAITNCTFWNIPANSSGVLVDNQFNKDQGDGVVETCTFLGPANSTGITWVGGDGLRVENNKFLTPTGFAANLSIGQAGGQLYIIGNSFDNTTQAINIFKQTDDGFEYTNILIADNQLFAYGATPQLISIQGQANSPVKNVTITGNQVFQDGGSITVSGGIVIGNYVSGFLIASNYVQSTVGTANGIYIGAQASNGFVTGNYIAGWGTPVLNNSGTTTVANNFTP